MTLQGQISFREEMEKKIAKDGSIKQIQQKEKMIMKQFSLTKMSYHNLIKGERKFVRDHNIPTLGFVTGFMDSELT